MKKTILLLIFALMLVNCKGQHSQEKVENFIYDFYHSYITLGLKPPYHNYIKDRDSLINTYCTKNIKNEIDDEDIDYDIIINAQDFCDEWLQTLNVERDKNANNTYYVSYSYKNYDNHIDTTRLKLFIVYENGNCKIDKIVDANNTNELTINADDTKTDMLPENRNCHKLKHKNTIVFSDYIRDRGHIYVVNGIDTVLLEKPILKYADNNNEQKTEDLLYSPYLTILQGTKDDLLWIFAEHVDADKPSYSGLYDLNGNLIEFRYSLKVSISETRDIMSDGNFDEVLEKYGVTIKNETKLPENKFAINW